MSFANQLYPDLLNLVKAILILLAAFISSLIVNRVLNGLWIYIAKALQEKDGATDFEREKHARTIVTILRKTAIVLIYIFAVVLALKVLGFDIVPLVAGVSVTALAIGFGAQQVVKDVISGFFMILEGSIRVNDVAIVNDVSGVVEEINLRTTVLRDDQGTVHVFQNGNILKLANRTREYSYYVFTLPVSYRDDPDTVADILRETTEQVRNEPAYAASVLAPVEVMGVDRLGDTYVVVKARIKTFPGKQWVIGREVNRRVRQQMQEHGMELPPAGVKTNG